MKKITVLSLLILTSLTLSGCFWTNENPEQWNKAPAKEDKEVISILEKFADELNVDKGNIKPSEFDRTNFDNQPYEEYTLNGYTLAEIKGVATKNLIETSKFFDWWHVNYIGDEAFWSRIEYTNDNIICYYSLSLEQQIPYELMVWEDENWNEITDYEERWKEFQEIATYETELTCWRLPENTHRLTDYNFDLAGAEPFWNAAMRGWKIMLNDVNWIKYFFPDTVNQEWDIIEFSWYNIKWMIKKAKCSNDWLGEEHDYTANFTFTTDDWELFYEWCADEIEFEFTESEEWTLKNFIKKTNYNYTQEYDANELNYVIQEITDNYMQVNFYINEENWEYHNYQAIFEKVDNAWKVIYEGEGYSISDDECEELNQYDNNLMEMFFLVTCPRG